VTSLKRKTSALAAAFVATMCATNALADDAQSCVAANQEFQVGFSLKTSGYQVQCQLVDDVPHWVKKEDDVPVVTLCLSDNSFYSVGALVEAEGRFVRCNTAGTWEAM
jgi:hypothetical protein